MQIKITPLTNRHSHLGGVFKAEHNYCLAKYPGAGTEIKKSDHWLEEAMRNSILNNIMHPLGSRTGEQIDQPFLMADYIYDDLGFIDLIFTKFIEGKFKKV